MNTQFVNDEGAVLMFNGGTSEGASKGWETRKGGKEFSKANHLAEMARGTSQKAFEASKNARTSKALEDHEEAESNHNLASSQHEDASNAYADMASKADRSGDKETGKKLWGLSNHHAKLSDTHGRRQEDHQKSISRISERGRDSDWE